MMGRKESEVILDFITLGVEHILLNLTGIEYVRGGTVFKGKVLYLDLELKN